MLSNHFICYGLVDQGCIGCLRLDRASFIHLLSESVLSSTEGARHQATLWNHLSCPSKIISTTFFSTTGYGVSMDSTIRDWKLLGAFMTLLFITDLPSQWFKISLWTSEMKTVIVLPPLWPSGINSHKGRIWSFLSSPWWVSAAPSKLTPRHWGLDASADQKQSFQRKTSP